jgi:hypothetical protein
MKSVTDYSPFKSLPLLYLPTGSIFLNFLKENEHLSLRQKNFHTRNFKEMLPVEIVLFHSERRKDATAVLVTILFAKAPKFVRVSSPIAAQCRCPTLFLKQPHELINANTRINVSKLC